MSSEPHPLSPAPCQVRSSLDGPLSQVGLTKPCTSEELLRIVSDTQQRFTESCNGELWRAALLPHALPGPEGDNKRCESSALSEAARGVGSLGSLTL